MDFKDQLKAMGERVLKLKEQILTEEATKNAFIMPFIQSLGYDVFNPLEVVPEFVADIGTKKGEKVDYAIFKDGSPTILIECKHWAQKLDVHDGQLLRYFHVSKAKFAILTNGVKYRFFTDLEEANKMDEKPFFEIDMTDLKENQVEELKKFHKSYFDIGSIVNTASDLKYTNAIKVFLSEELKNPSESLIKFLVSKVYDGRMTEKVLFQFSELVKKSVQQVISDMITDRLKSALDKETAVVAEQTNQQTNQEATTNVENSSEPKIITTEEEIEAFFIVKSILRQKIDSSRITYKDTLSYFAILLDGSVRKTVCRLFLNSTSKKYISLFDDATKKDVKYDISSLDDIYKYGERILQIADTYDKLKTN